MVPVCADDSFNDLQLLVGEYARSINRLINEPVEAWSSYTSAFAQRPTVEIYFVHLP